MRLLQSHKGLILLVIPVALVPVWWFATARAAAPAGQTVYAQNCAKCHGVDGKGDGPLAASFSPKPIDFTNQKLMSARSDAFLTRVIEKGGAAGGLSAQMPAFGSSLSPAQVKSVVAYLRTLAQKGGAQK